MNSILNEGIATVQRPGRSQIGQLPTCCRALIYRRYPLSHRAPGPHIQKAFPGPDVFHFAWPFFLFTTVLNLPGSPSKRVQFIATGSFSLAVFSFFFSLLLQHDLVAADCRSGSGSHARSLTNHPGPRNDDYPRIIHDGLRDEERERT